MVEILHIAGSLGVGALLGVIIFLMYRQDRKSSERRILEDRKSSERRHLEAWKNSEERLTQLINQDQETRQENTKALTELITLISRLNGRLSGG